VLAPCEINAAVGQEQSDCLRQKQGSRMSTSVWKNTPSGRTVRRNPKKQTKPFVMLPKYMIRSDAWQALSGGAVAAYVELACRYDGLNNGRLHLSCREQAESRHCSSVKDRKRQAAEYRLTGFHCDVTRQPPSKAFMKWHPEKHFTVHPGAQHGALGCTEAKIH
jgi:hypothetical protein